MASAFLVGVFFPSCDPSPDLPSGNDKAPEPEEITLQDKINAGGAVDLEGEKVSEDLTVSGNITLKNADFDGKTITLKSGKATLSGITNAVIRMEGNCELTLEDGSSINEILVSGNDLALTLKGASNVSTVTLSDNYFIRNFNIEGSNDSVISELKISSETEYVAISGVTVEKVSGEQYDSSYDKCILKVAGGAKINKIDVKDNDNRNISIYIEKADENVTVPDEGAAVLTLKEARLEARNAIKTYSIGDSFNYMGLSVELVYEVPDYWYTRSVTVPLESLKSDIIIEGFDTGKEIDSQKITIKYKGTPLTGDELVISVKKAEYTDNLLNEAVNSLANGDYDGGIRKIEEAYKSKATDETRMYMALAKLALVTKDADMVSFMKNNMGISDYTGSLNEIIDDDYWYNIFQNENFLKNIGSGNKNGFEDAIKKVLSSVTKVYAEAKTLASGIGEDSVVVPAKLIDALYLDEILGSYDVKIGKAELNLVVATVGVLKGFLEYCSAFNTEVNFEKFANSVVESDYDDLGHAMMDMLNSSSSILTIKDASGLEKAKASLVGALDLAITSYENILSSNKKVYPNEVKDYIKKGEIFKDGASVLKDAIQNGKKFFVIDPSDWIDSGKKWPVTKDACGEDLLFTIDFEGLFSKDALDQLIERDASGKIQFYVECGGGYDYNYDTLKGIWDSGEFYDGSEWCQISTYVDENGVNMVEISREESWGGSASSDPSMGEVGIVKEILTYEEFYEKYPPTDPDYRWKLYEWDRVSEDWKVDIEAKKIASSNEIESVLEGARNDAAAIVQGELNKITDPMYDFYYSASLCSDLCINLNFKNIVKFEIFDDDIIKDDKMMTYVGDFPSYYAKERFDTVKPSDISIKWEER